MGKWAKYGKKYVSAWEKEKDLKDWIQRVHGNEMKAYCKFCKIEIRAHHGDLINHAATNKHERNALLASSMRKLFKTGVSKSCGDSAVKAAEIKIAAHISLEMEKWAKLGIKYVNAWENEDDLKNWIQRVQGDEMKAYCKFCKTEIRAHHGDLITHASTNKHKRNALLASDMRMIQSKDSKSDGEASVKEAEIKNAPHISLDLMEKWAKLGKKYVNAWEKEGYFKDWIQCVQGDEMKAYCKFCKMEIIAHHSDLIAHASTNKHKRNALSASGMKMFQARVSKSDGNASVKAAEIKNAARISLEVEKWAKFGKKYVKAWEKEEDLKDWIQRVQGDEMKAYCKFCKTEIRAHHSDLITHASTNKHKRNALSASGMRMIQARVSKSNRDSSVKNKTAMARRIAAILIDLSGTIHIDDTVLPGAIEALKRLRTTDVKIKFVTNTTRESKRVLHDRLTRIGFQIEKEEIFTSLTAARQLIEKRNLQPYMLIADAAKEEFSHINQEKHNAVLVGLAPERFDYDHMTTAFRLLIDGAPLIAVHKSRYYKRSDGLALGPGAFVTALEYSSGCEAEVVGKPESSFFVNAVEDLECSPLEAVMIGDDVQDDVQGAMDAGLLGILVKTGKYRTGDESTIDPEPSFIADNFAHAVDYIINNLLKTP